MPSVKKLGWWFSKYKWELLEDWEYQTNILGYSAITEFVSLSVTGLLKFKKGYRWDGASGPTWDTLSCRRGALVHDGLYQLLRTCKIPQSCKIAADLLLYRLCVNDGMIKFRAWIWLKSVQLFGVANCDNQIQN